MRILAEIGSAGGESVPWLQPVRGELGLRALLLLEP